MKLKPRLKKVSTNRILIFVLLLLVSTNRILKFFVIGRLYNNWETENSQNLIAEK